jgi:hypothetical protein
MQSYFMNASAKEALLKLREESVWEPPHPVLKLVFCATDFAAEQFSFRGVGLVIAFCGLSSMRSTS